MSSTDEKLTKTHIKSMILSMRNEIAEEITNELENRLRPIKTQIKSVFDTIETIQQSNSVFQREVNLKIGALRGHETRQSKPQPEKFLEFNSVEEALAYVEKIRNPKMRALREDTRSDGVGPTLSGTGGEEVQNLH